MLGWECAGEISLCYVQWVKMLAIMLLLCIDCKHVLLHNNLYSVLALNHTIVAIGMSSMPFHVKCYDWCCSIFFPFVLKSKCTFIIWVFELHLRNRAYTFSFQSKDLV